MILKSVEFRMPSFGEDVNEIAHISKWFIKVGDEIRAGDIIVEVESDKAVFEIPATTEGAILYLAKNEKESVVFNEVLCVIGEKKVEKSIVHAHNSNNYKSNQQINLGENPNFEVIIPNLGQSIKFVEISFWNVKDRQIVESGDIIAELDSDKASFEVPADRSGIIYIHSETNKKLAIGTKIATIVSDNSNYKSRSK